VEHGDSLEEWYDKHKIEYENNTDVFNSGDLYRHQQEDVDRFTGSSEIAIFAEMGCGKSAIALRIAGEKYLRGDINSLLVIAPNGVHKQWCTNEIPKWLQPEVEREVQCLFGRGGAKEARPFINKNALQIVCVNVDTFSTPKKWEEIVRWALVRKTFIVLDESSAIKSYSAKRTQRIVYGFNQNVRKGKSILASKPLTVARAILTGTPVTNGPYDLYTMMEYLRPNFFKRNWYSFMKHYGMHTSMFISDACGNARKIDVLLNEEQWSGIKEIMSYAEAYEEYGVSLDTFNTIHSQSSYQGPYKHADELKEMLKPVASFRLLKDCVDMPGQTYITRTLDMGDDIAVVYNEMCELLIAEFGGVVTSAKSKIAAIVRLQQISSGFVVEDMRNVTEEEIEDPPERIVKWIGKSNAKLDALMRDIEESSKPVIIITHFTVEAERIYEALKDKYRTCLMTGWKKVGSIEDYQEGKYDVMVANIRVISRGFNLQNGCKMLFYSNTFSLEDRLQVEGRIWRIGQSRPCAYVDYIYTGTVDTKIVAALQQKRSLLDYIRGTKTEAFIKEEDEVTEVGVA
jgi:SNF2 family DNA or RNA helicase